MEFKKVSASYDPVTIYATEDGFYKIIKRPSEKFWTVKEYSLFDILGTTVGQYETLEDAMNCFQ